MRHGRNSPWQLAGDGVRLRVRLTPKSSFDAIEGIEATADGPALKARVRAVPEDGAANAALERLIANWLGVPKRDVTLAHGGKSRIKTLTIAGEPGVLQHRLEERLAAIG